MNECPYYILCGNNCCEDFFNGTSCLDCNFFFSGNKMEMLEDECCVCADNELQLGIKFPYCSHSVCIEHMKEYYLNNGISFHSSHLELFENSTNLYFPEFPYDENIEYSYNLYKLVGESDCHINFENDPLIIKYENDSDNYIDTRDDWIYNNCHKPALEKCPLCRKKLGFASR